MTAATPSTVVSRSPRICGRPRVTIDPSARATPAARASSPERRRTRTVCCAGQAAGRVRRPDGRRTSPHYGLGADGEPDPGRRPVHAGARAGPRLDDVPPGPERPEGPPAQRDDVAAAG